MLTTSQLRQAPKIRINWDAVDRLMQERGVASDAELSRLSGIPQSTIYRARETDRAASVSVISALVYVFPDVIEKRFDSLLVVPKSDDLPTSLAS